MEEARDIHSNSPLVLLAVYNSFRCWHLLQEIGECDTVGRHVGPELAQHAHVCKLAYQSRLTARDETPFNVSARAV